MLSVRLSLKKILQRLKIISDFVVETGTDGIWTYEKRNSGIAECWGMVASKSYSITKKSGSGYYADGLVTAFPESLFTDIKHVDVTSVGTTGLVNASVVLVNTENVIYRLWCSASLTWSGRISVRVKGYWKTPNLGGGSS